MGGSKEVFLNLKCLEYIYSQGEDAGKWLRSADSRMNPEQENLLDYKGNGIWEYRRTY